MSACSDESGVKKLTNAAPVKTSVVERKKVNHTLTFLGNVQPSASVNVAPRVSGQIEAIHFTEGQNVKKGDLLVELDSDSYKADLAEKEADYLKIKSRLAKALEDNRRYGKLAAQGFVSKEVLDETRTSLATLKAELEAASAAIAKARLNLEYCSIRAPISGRIGKINIDKGNIISPNTVLSIATIDTISPLYVTFSVPEVFLPIIMKEKNEKELELSASPPGGEESKGKLTLIDNSVDKSSGTILLRGTFQNENYSLWPGQFVNVKLPIKEMDNAKVIPTQAIQQGREGLYIYGVDDTEKAILIPIQKIFESGDKSIIEGDIKGGQKVIMEGQIRLQPGMSIREEKR